MIVEGRSAPPLPSFSEALRVWLRIGLLSFGGPAGQIALLHREVVDERRWISDRRFLHALNFCTLLPGPEAQQLATYLGWLMHGPLGGLAAGLLFILPGALVMLVLSASYAVFGSIQFISALFFGLKCAVLVLVLEALLRVAKRALKSQPAWFLAVAAFVALFFCAVPFPAVVLAAGLIGYVWQDWFTLSNHGKAHVGSPSALDAVLDGDPGRVARYAASARRAGFLALLLWLLPVGLLLAVGGLYADIAWFFSKMAVVTFGGAYAVLAYAAQDTVQSYHWLTAPEMLAGLGLAETTPGPLILVLQFVGFLAGFRSSEAMTGIIGGILASLLTLWVTFAPCFAFVFLGAPLIERLQQHRPLSSAMGAITASVVGVICNLAVWFAIQSLFHKTTSISVAFVHFDLPELSSLDPLAAGLAVLSGVLLLTLKLGVPKTLALSAAASLALHLVGAV